MPPDPAAALDRRIVDYADVRRSVLSAAGARVDHLYHAFVRRRFATVTRALGRRIAPGSVILDVGANHGRFTKHLAALHGRSCRVYAFEPIPYNLEMLRLVAGRARNVAIVPLALAADAGEHDIFLPYKRASGRLLHGSAHLGAAGRERHFGTRTAPDLCRVPVRTVRLDDWAAGESLARLDLMKIDVEGAEALVIEGGLATIERFKPVIFAELIPGTPERVERTVDDVVRPLRELGYTMLLGDARLASPRPVEGCRPGGRDYLFLPPGHPDACVTGRRAIYHSA